MNMLELKKGLYTKVEHLAAAIGKLQKDGTNTFSRYKYITHEQVSTALRSELLNQNLSIVADMVDYNETQFPADSKGRVPLRTVVKMLFTITDLETGHQETHTFFGAEQDTGGKSMQQAVSQCNKYFLFKTLKITDQGEDGDAQTTAVKTPAKKAPVKKAPAKPKPVVNVRGLEALKSDISQIKTADKVREYFIAVPKAERPDGFQDACAVRVAEIEKVTEYPVKGSKGDEYIVTHSAKGWACTCDAFKFGKGKPCKHIKLTQPIS